MASAIYAIPSEIGPFATEALSEQGTISAMKADMLAPGLSIQSQIDFLYHCRVALTSVTGRAQPTSVRRDFLEQCGDASAAMVAASPGFSAAWYTSALVASFSGESARMNTPLEQSYKTGPFEQWIAELRVDLVEDNFEDFDQRLLPRHLEDLKNLLSNDRGRRLLAPRYLIFSDLADRIDTQLAEADEAEARRFYNIVDRLRVQRERTNGR